MEAVGNMASAAAKAVWGTSETKEAKQEPISGVNGDTSKGEPYDAGNMKPSQQADMAGSNESNETSGAPVAPHDTTMGQNDTRTPSNPATKPDVEQQDVQMDSATLDGPGPKPLSTVAKEHGGDAGNCGKTDSSSSLSSSSSEESKGEEDEPYGIQDKKKGTGEQWVKSSGLMADGGDFDASAPGAGREADRLLEQKGVKKVSSAGEEKTNGINGHDINDANGTSAEKPSLKEKIKAKLHAH